MSPARTHLRALTTGAHADTRTDLERLCAGEPVLMDRIDLIDFANSRWPGLDPNVDPDDHLLAEAMLAWFHDHVGVERRTEGDRSTGIAGDLRRYLLPFALETTAALPATRRSIAQLRVADVRHLPRILAGDLPLPAATVAGDLLRRRALTCVWLNVSDAADVSHGGRPAVLAALADATIARHHDAHGQVAIFAADLRAAGLLIEHTPDQDTEPDEDIENGGHGLQITTAGNILSVLAMVSDHARANGANLRGDFHALRAIKPIPSRRKRRPAAPPSLVTLAMVRRVCRHLHPTAQVVLWCLRLLGLRISELYGVKLSDLLVVDGRQYMRVYRQGGRVTLQRDRVGALSAVEVKERTKTEQSKRVIPLPHALSDLLESYIAMYHTDPATGVRDPDARLIVGLRHDDTSGQGGLRSSLVAALAQEGVETGDELRRVLAYFHPHDLRAGLITDLTRAGVDKRVREMYTGHWNPKDAHEGYDRGASDTELLTIAEATDELISASTDLHDLRVPTAKRESFGTTTRLAQVKETIRGSLRECGWYDPTGERTTTGTDDDVTPLTAPEVGQRLGVSPQRARLLMREGTIDAFQVPWGARSVWVATPSAVDAYLDARSGTRLNEVAPGLGLAYHQALDLAKTLDVLPADRERGETIFLSPDAVSALHSEMQRRRSVLTDVMNLPSAAKQLGLPIGQVERMVRNNTLQRAPSPTGVRRRYVTRESVEAVAATMVTATHDGDTHAVPLKTVQAALDLTRYELSDLIRTGQLAATSVDRRQCVRLQAALTYARQHAVAAYRLAQLEAAAIPAPH
ncbi:phage integrase family protein [mine drainage metagenome]|uniref:Phage integrase family protein n=1 Tax=mine drainage metagenome TaxID=410659 RepID=A0A1J5PZ62_9ZZZZ